MADLFNELLGSLDSLSEDQITELMARLEAKKSGSIQNAKEQGLLVENEEIVACTHCGSVAIKKHGKSQGKQRYMCKDCKKTFLQTTGTMFHHSKLTSYQWKELLRGVVQNLSLTKIADITGISIKAVWYNRQKVLSILYDMFHKQDKFIDIAECDEYSVHLSFKGKKDPRFFIYQLGRMPRHNRSITEKVEYLQKNGLWDELQSDKEHLEALLTGDRYIPGTNRDSVCILSGKDRSGNIYLRPVCVGSIESAHVCKSFKDRFESDAIMVTDSNNSYNWFAEYENIHHEQILASKHAKGSYNLARINAIHSKLSSFWPDDRENLPSTKHLDFNLMLFWWLEKNGDLSTQQQIEKLYSYLAQQVNFNLTYEKITTRRLLLDTKGLIPIKV